MTGNGRIGRWRLAGGLLAAIAVVAPITLPAGRAGALDLRPASHSMAGLRLTGTIKWKQSSLFQSSDETSRDTQSGTFTIDMISTKLPYTGDWSTEDGSTYDVAYTRHLVITAGDCTTTESGEVTGKGAFSSANDNGAVLHAFWWGDKWPQIGLDISVAKIMPIKVDSCNGPGTTAKGVTITPTCYKQHPSGLGALFSGDFNGEDDTVNLDCSGDLPATGGNSGTYSITGTLHVDAYMFVLPRSTLTPAEWKRVLLKPHHDHPSADIPVPAGTPYFAVTAGKVIYTTKETCGDGITLVGMDGVHYTYCHGSKRIAPEGKNVPPGTELGLTGNTGSPTTGPHLHFQISYDGAEHCPQNLLWALYDGTQPPPDAHYVYALPETGCFYVTVIVNSKTVRIDGNEATGLEIKHAAIAQGVDIKPDYHLTETGPNGQHIPIGDAQKIHLHDKEKFTATAP